MEYEGIRSTFLIDMFEKSAANLAKRFSTSLKITTENLILYYMLVVFRFGFMD
jgi:hypothetical protein